MFGALGRPKFLHAHAECAEPRKKLFIHAFELKLQHFEVYVEAKHLQCFPPTRYVSVRYLETSTIALYPISLSTEYAAD